MWVGGDWGNEKNVSISRFLLQQLAGKRLGSVTNTTGPGQAEAGTQLRSSVTSSGHLTVTCSITPEPGGLSCSFSCLSLSDPPGPRFSLGGLAAPSQLPKLSVRHGICSLLG